MLHLNKHQMIPRENSKPPIPSADSSTCRPAAPPCVVLSIHSWKAWLPQLERISYGNCESQQKILGTFFGFTYVYIYIQYTPKKKMCVCVALDCLTGTWIHDDSCIYIYNIILAMSQVPSYVMLRLFSLCLPRLRAEPAL